MGTHQLSRLCGWGGAGALPVPSPTLATCVYPSGFAGGAGVPTLSHWYVGSGMPDVEQTTGYTRSWRSVTVTY